MPDRKDNAEVRGSDAPASAPAGQQPKQEIRGVAQRDNVKGKTHNSQTRQDEDD